MREKRSQQRRSVRLKFSELAGQFGLVLGVGTVGDDLAQFGEVFIEFRDGLFELQDIQTSHALPPFPPKSALHGCHWK